MARLTLSALLTGRTLRMLTLSQQQQLLQQLLQQQMLLSQLTRLTSRRRMQNLLMRMLSSLRHLRKLKASQFFRKLALLHSTSKSVRLPSARRNLHTSTSTLQTFFLTLMARRLQFLQVALTRRLVQLSVTSTFARSVLSISRTSSLRSMVSMQAHS